ncbi:MAG: hypothetical protein KA479_14350 [Saprospiraceae bacterium]|nr:hypothetical protein [Saprospiraceae bacterium]
MKHINYISLFFVLVSLTAASSQSVQIKTAKHSFPVAKLTIEPAIGLNPYSMGNFLVSNIVQWNIEKHLSIVSYTSYAYNNALDRDFNYIRTDYNNSLTQKFGIGTSLYGKRSAHTFSLMAGIKYDAFQETLHNPEFEPVTASVKSVSPDFGLMYNGKIGKGKCFFSYRMYLPIYPYPLKSFDIWSIDGNLANITMEFGMGIRLQ